MSEDIRRWEGDNNLDPSRRRRSDEKRGAVRSQDARLASWLSGQHERVIALGFLIGQE